MSTFIRRKRKTRTYWVELGFLVLGIFGLKPDLLTGMLEQQVQQNVDLTATGDWLKDAYRKTIAHNDYLSNALANTTPVTQVAYPGTQSLYQTAQYAQPTYTQPAYQYPQTAYQQAGYQQPHYTAGQYSTQQYPTQQYLGQQLPAQQYANPQYANPQYSASNYNASAYNTQQYTAPQYSAQQYNSNYQNGVQPPYRPGTYPQPNASNLNQAQQPHAYSLGANTLGTNQTYPNQYAATDTYAMHNSNYGNTGSLYQQYFGNSTNGLQQPNYNANLAYNGQAYNGQAYNSLAYNGLAAPQYGQSANAASNLYNNSTTSPYYTASSAARYNAPTTGATSPFWNPAASSLGVPGAYSAGTGTVAAPGAWQTYNPNTYGSQPTVGRY